MISSLQIFQLKCPCISMSHMCPVNPSQLSLLCTILPRTHWQSLQFIKLSTIQSSSSFCPSWYQIILVAFYSHTTSCLFSSSCQTKISFLLFIWDSNFIKTNWLYWSTFITQANVAQIIRILPRFSIYQKPIVVFTVAHSLCLFWVK
jgi:hypothetical protein